MDEIKPVADADLPRDTFSVTEFDSANAAVIKFFDLSLLRPMSVYVLKSEESVCNEHEKK